mmetsp:Transcript_33236/g.68004  ORF Transcript_33236/g.68004 Transcript_33236/m.68004 type:complete len:94 (-) Transcript_33236:683-964(-)
MFSLVPSLHWGFSSNSKYANSVAKVFVIKNECGGCPDCFSYKICLKILLISHLGYSNDGVPRTQHSTCHNCPTQSTINSSHSKPQAGQTTTNQ